MSGGRRPSHPAKGVPAGSLAVEVQALVRRWQAQRVALLPPPHPAAVRRTFERLGVAPPPELLVLYARVGGMAPSVMDTHLWRLWSVDELAVQAAPGRSGIAFADYLMHSHVYRLQPVDGAPASVWADDPGAPGSVEVAESLAAFFHATA